MARRVLSCILLLALLASLAGTVQARSSSSLPPTTALVAITISSPAELDSFSATALPIYARITGGLLTGAGADGLQTLAGTGLTYRVLDPAIDDLIAGVSAEGLYLVYPAPNRAFTDWALYGRVLAALEDGEVLLRTSPQLAERASLAGAELQRLTFDPKPAYPGMGQEYPEAITPDPLIQQMIDQVSSADVSTYDRQMAGELPVWVEGAWYTITTRQTYSGTPIYKTTHWYGEQFANLGLSVEYHAWNTSNNPNVIGELTGRINPDDIYIIGGHIDDVSGSPGADDNASGPIAALIAANIMTQYQWGCTLRFAVWTGEEQGLLGSGYYAQRSFNAGENILGYLNLDMIAWNTIGSSPDIDLVYRADRPPTQQLAQLFADVVDAYNVDLVPGLRSSTSANSDHASFWQYGYTAIMGIEDNGDFNPYYHSSQDTPAHTDVDYFTEFVKASVGTFAHMSGCLIPAGIGYLDGHATEQGTGLPIEGVTVTAGDPAGHSFLATTDATGYYTRTLLANSYTVTATHPQYVTAVVPNVQVLTDTVTTQDFSLVRRGWIWGYVTDADNGFPLAATVSVPGFGSVQTNPDTGYYEIYTDGGNRTATASATNYANGTATVNVTLGQGTRHDFALLANVSFVPKPLHVYVPLNGMLNTPATLTNRLAGAYPFELFEIPGGYRPSLVEATAPVGAEATWPGPDGFGYRGESVTYEWVEIRTTGTPVSGLTDDSYAGPFNVGFPFPFYGSNQTQFFVGSNGYLTFGSGSSDIGADCPFPNSATPNNLIALMWDDLYPNYSTGGVYYQSFASCPVGAGSCLILEYYNWNHYGGGTSGTFEIILMDNGSIRMQFLDGGNEQGSGSATGIEGNNAPANYGLQYACRAANSIVDGLALCYAYPNSSGCVAADVPWLGEDPTSGIIPSGGSFDVTMLFTATSAAGVTQPGEYTATLLVAGTPSLRVPVTMTVYPDTCQPVQIITVTQQPAGCVVSFGAQLSGDEPIAYLWDFGPFGASTAPTPTVDFGQTGSYPASLEVTNCGGTASIDFTVDVVCNECEPVQIISVTSEISGCAVTWSAELTGTSPYEYLWDFGPFGTSTATNPIFDYGQNGAYTGTLTVSNCEGANEDSAALEVTVDCTPPCEPVSGAAFSWTPLNPGAGEPVTFTGTATGTEPISFTWDLGDGTVGAGATIVHTYTLSGTYVVTMVADNECGEETITHTIVVTEVSQCEPPTGVAFGWTPPTPLPGDVVTFSGSASGTEPIAYSWDLGDGATGSGATLTHTYAAAGSYLVTLTATNDCGTEAVSHLVTVAEGCVEPGGANFSWSPITPTAGALVTFDASLITGTEPLSYAWSFGDGATGSGDPATHTYTADGSYTAILTVSNECGQQVVQHAIVVVGVCEPAEQLAFDWTPLTPTVGQAVSFTATATGTLPIDFSWSFGDGGTGSGAVVAHTYTLAGAYTVEVTATNGCGVQTMEHSLVVVGIPQMWTVYLPIVVKN